MFKNSKKKKKKMRWIEKCIWGNITYKYPVLPDTQSLLAKFSLYCVTINKDVDSYTGTNTSQRFVVRINWCYYKSGSGLQGVFYKRGLHVVIIVRKWQNVKRLSDILLLLTISNVIYALARNAHAMAYIVAVSFEFRRT